jgi:hypothetical protein
MLIAAETIMVVLLAKLRFGLSQGVRLAVADTCREGKGRLFKEKLDAELETDCVFGVVSCQKKQCGIIQ